ncbi:MAG: hypothetical protein IPG43_08325 [Proteobacteria bacterium]|nr:hypothetical protein [Pseudomonadota bacterium]
MTTLAHERRNADALRRWGHASPYAGAIYDQERAEIATVMEPYKWYPQRAGRVDLIMSRARETGRLADPALRQDMARLMMLSRSAEWLAHRARQAKVAGKPEGPEGSLGKLVASHVARAASHVHTLISGADAMLAGADGPHDGLIAEILLSVPATSIAGGTDEIQRNIIGERVLDLPREPRMDSGPFRDVPRNPTRGGMSGHAGDVLWVPSLTFRAVARRLSGFLCVDGGDAVLRIEFEAGLQPGRARRGTQARHAVPRTRGWVGGGLALARAKVPRAPARLGRARSSAVARARRVPGGAGRLRGAQGRGLACARGAPPGGARGVAAWCRRRRGRRGAPAVRLRRAHRRKSGHAPIHGRPAGASSGQQVRPLATYCPPRLRRFQAIRHGACHARGWA